MASKTFRLTENYHETGDVGAVHTVDVDTVTEENNGVRVDTHTTGTVEGTHINRRSSTFYPGVTLASATAYRLRHGYVLVSESGKGGKGSRKSPAELDREIDEWARGVSERAAKERTARKQNRPAIRPHGKRDV